MKKYQRGFTLIELVMVIVILGVLAVVALTVASPAMAANWVKLMEDQRGTDYYDSDSVGKIVSGYRTIWQRIIYADKSSFNTEAVLLLYFDCQNSSSAVKSEFQIHSNGTTDQQTVGTNALQFEPIVPGTLYEHLMKMVCP